MEFHRHNPLWGNKNLWSGLVWVNITNNFISSERGVGLRFRVVVEQTQSIHRIYRSILVLSYRSITIEHSDLRSLIISCRQWPCRDLGVRCELWSSQNSRSPVAVAVLRSHPWCFVIFRSTLCKPSPILNHEWASNERGLTV